MFIRIASCAAICLGGWVSCCLASDAGRLDTTIDPYVSDKSTANAEVEPYSHNGSDMIIETRGDSIHIRYEKPRAGLASVGAKSGTLLFTGRRTGDNVEGTAFVFKANCPPAAYSVRGRFNAQFNLTLEGLAPHWDRNSCAIVSYTKGTVQSRLVFFEAFGDT
jgi:hypothetical protein